MPGNVVSGPGALSARTDLGNLGGAMNPNSPNYGEGVDVQNLKQSAPLAGTGANAGGQGAPAPSPVAGPQSVTGLGQPTERPGENVTTGATYTPGAPPPDPNDQSVAAMDPGLINTLLRQASLPGADPAFQRAVRQVYSYVR